MLLAGSADAGYVTFLRQYCEESGLAARLTLIESVPFPSSFRQLSAKFHNTKFEAIFRDSKLVVEQRSPHNPNRPTYALTVAGLANAGVQSPPYPDPATLNSAIPDPRSSQMAHLNRVWLRPMQFNAQGHRVDEPLPSWDKQVEMELKQRNLCPKHFLTECHETWCSKAHDGSIDDKEKAALIRIAQKEKPGVIPSSLSIHRSGRRVGSFSASSNAW